MKKNGNSTMEPLTELQTLRARVIHLEASLRTSIASNGRALSTSSWRNSVGKVSDGDVLINGGMVRIPAKESLGWLAADRGGFLERVQRMLQQMPIACILCDEQSRVTCWNPAAERIFGYSFAEVQGQPFGLLTVDGSQEALSRVFERVTAGETVADVIAENVTKDGQTIVCQWSFATLLDDLGRAAGNLAMCRDVTERTQAEQKLRDQEAHLAHIARLSTMGEMVAGIAHEITQPLYAIGNYAGACAALLEKNIVVAEPLREWVTKIGELVNRSGNIISRLRNFSRRAHSTREFFDVQAMIQESIELVALEARRHRVQVHCHVDGATRLFADRIQIQQVLVNLLRNAYEALARDPHHDRQVIVRAQAQNDQLLIAVEDNGPGLLPHVAEKLFQAFNTGKSDGLGIGLAISRTIVEAHEGKISAAANASRGVTFQFALPRSETAAANINGQPPVVAGG